MIKKEYFCSYPFNTFFLGSDGGVKFCCSSKMNLGNINESPIEEILQNELAQEVRKSIITGKWHMPHCAQCFEIERNGGNSERSNSLFHYYDRMKVIDQVSYFKLEKIDIRWTNTCNLACNYCYEYFSSKWAKILGISAVNNRDNAEELVFQFIEKHKDSIQSVNLLGGEPLLQKQNEKLVQQLSNSNYYILSNMSVPLESNKVANELMKIGPTKVSIGVSFETLGDKFEYVRHGASWTKFTDNIKLLKSKGYKLNAHPVFCIYSALNLVEYYDFIDSTGYFDEVYWSLLINIDALDVFKHTKDVKREVIAEIDRCVSKYSTKYNLDMLVSIRDKLQQQVNEITNNITSDRENIIMEELKRFVDRIENNYLPDKQHTMKELWPDLMKDDTKETQSSPEELLKTKIEELRKRDPFIY